MNVSADHAVRGLEPSEATGLIFSPIFPDSARISSDGIFSTPVQDGFLVYVHYNFFLARVKNSSFRATKSVSGIQFQKDSLFGMPVNPKFHNAFSSHFVHSLEDLQCRVHEELHGFFHTPPHPPERVASMRPAPVDLAQLLYVGGFYFCRSGHREMERSLQTKRGGGFWRLQSGKREGILPEKILDVGDVGLFVD